MSFLPEPPVTPRVQALFDADVAQDGYISNVSRLWAYQPDTLDSLFEVLAATIKTERLTIRQRGILITACASAMGDSYCSLGWGGKLTKVADGPLAAGVLTGDDSALSDSETALARWARSVARDPNGTTRADVEKLRDAGFTDGQVFAITAYVALRLAFSTVNDALGAQPDAEFRDAAHPDVLAAVSFGRPIDPVRD
jgi:alkylhydroperoxidase family enzyme